MSNVVLISREVLERTLNMFDEMYLHYVVKADKSSNPMKSLEHRRRAHEILCLMSDIEDALDPKE